MDGCQRPDDADVLPPALGLLVVLPRVLDPPDQIDGNGQILHQVRREVVVEQIDEAPEGFGRTRALRWFMQQSHQGIVDVVAAGVGRPEHAADH